MKKPFIRFFPITALALVITLGFISCSLEQLLSDDTKKSEPSKPGIPIFFGLPPVADVSHFFGTWVTEEKDGIKKEVEILKDTNYYDYVERTYLNGVLYNEQEKRYKYAENFYYYSSGLLVLAGKDKKMASFLTFDKSDDVTFSIENNKLTLGGGDNIRYKGNNNNLKGDWSYESETYSVDITFVPYTEEQGKMVWKLTRKSPFPFEHFECFSYKIKNNNTLIFTDDKDTGRFKKRIELIDGRLHMINVFVSNKQIEEYNNAHPDKQFDGEMLGLSTNWVGRSDNIANLYSSFDEEYYHKK